MKRTSIALGITLTLFFAIAAMQTAVVSLAAAQAKAQDDFQLVKVADGIYAGIAKPGGLASGNAGFVVGEDGVLIVDTFFTPVALEELIGEIQAQTQSPVKFAVNTHYHLDHTGGNQVLVARGVPIIAHDNVAIWQTTKNKRFLRSPEDLEKLKADVAKKLSEIADDQKDKRAPLEAQLRRLNALQSIKLTNPTITFGSGSMHL
jgi:glyoxylase-like metal-dependent hydrolase (beta-lactamase superfamily II)